MFSLDVDDEIKLDFYTEENAAEVFKVVTENYAHLYQWSPWLDENYSLERATEFAKLCQKQFEEKTSIPLCIKLNGKIVGGTGFNAFNWEYKSAEIGYWLAKEHNGKGIVTKSCRRMLNYAFDELKLNRIVLRCVPTNEKSRKIPERLGFTNEGIERQGGFHHNRFVDFVIYSMLSEEWGEKLSGKK